MAVIIGICSVGIRTGFRGVTKNFSFHGGQFPEIGIFNILLYLSVVFGFFSVILRYSYILDEKQILPTYTDYINKTSVAVGILSFLGLFIIASFPASSSEENSTVQSAGAYIFIGLGLFYTALQTFMTYSSVKYSVTYIIRSFLTVSLMSTFISSIVLLEINKEKHPISIPTGHQTNGSEQIIYHGVGGQAQLIACALVWASVVVYALFFLSFVEEFQRISSYVILRPFVIPNPSDFRSSSLTVNERV